MFLSARPKHRAPPTSLEDQLTWLRGFGKPRISCHDSGWYASIDMNTIHTGTKFEVCSEFGLPTPTAAMNQLLERLAKVLT